MEYLNSLLTRQRCNEMSYFTVRRIRKLSVCYHQSPRERIFSRCCHYMIQDVNFDIFLTKFLSLHCFYTNCKCIIAKKSILIVYIMSFTRVQWLIKLILDMVDFDEIHRMDWFHSYYALLNYRTRVFNFHLPNVPKVFSIP